VKMTTQNPAEARLARKRAAPRRGGSQCFGSFHPVYWSSTPFRSTQTMGAAVSCSVMSVDHRETAKARIDELTALLQSAGDANSGAIVTECEALSRAIAAFHMEGIRFRIYNVDRLLHAHQEAPSHAATLLEEARKHLEAAGFHTRSHQAPI
jgi:hypothetical protein